MNKDLMRQAGFGKQVDMVEQGICPFCGKKVNMKDFRDELSRREFQISGLCQKCQDETFKEERKSKKIKSKIKRKCGCKK